jgi:predicted nucleotidyltransferase
MERIEIEKNIVDYMLSYNPTRIGIFGSYARGEETMSSDIDLLVQFKQTPSLLQLINGK